MSFQTNRFCWAGCISTDTDVAKAFYTEVIGWKTETVPMGESDATFFKAGGEQLAHIASPAEDGIPSHWNNYLRVDDVDATAKAAVANGGQQLVPGTDIAPGRFSVVASPSGATFSLFKEASADSEHHPGGPGSVHWVELHSKDVDADLSWLKSTFGYETEQMDMPSGPYSILTADGEPRGGVMASQQETSPSVWLTWVHVDDVDATVDRARSNAGTVVAPAWDIPTVGRLAIIEDPTGGVLGVMTPSTVSNP